MIGRVPDLGLFRTVEVTVARPVSAETDPFNASRAECEETAVAGVLPQPGGTSDLGAERPSGARVDMTFHFPRGYDGSLKGCAIAYAGSTYRVIGDPRPTLPDITPGPFGLAVETERVDG